MIILEINTIKDFLKTQNYSRYFSKMITNYLFNKVKVKNKIYGDQP